MFFSFPHIIPNNVYFILNTFLHWVSCVSRKISVCDNTVASGKGVLVTLERSVNFQKIYLGFLGNSIIGGLFIIFHQKILDYKNQSDFQVEGMKLSNLM